MIRTRLLTVAFAVLAVLAAGCQEQFQDLDTEFYADPREHRQEYPVRIANPDSLTIYRNADGFPNVEIVCVQGVPFSTTSANHAGGLRQVVDADHLCADASSTEGLEPVDDDSLNIGGDD